MKISLIQKMIDIVRAKDLQKEYEALRETVRYLSEVIDFDKNIAKRILKKHICPYLTFKNDKNALKKYLATINASKIPQATGNIRELQIRLLDLAKEIVADFEAQNIHPFMIGGTLLGAVRHGGYIPWDDDIDFDIMRDEYNKMGEYIKSKYICLDTDKFSNYSDFLAEMDKSIQNNPNKVIFAKKATCTSAYLGTSLEDSIVLDFFPREVLAPNLTEEEYLKYRISKQDEYLSQKTWADRFKFFENEFKNKNVYSKDGKLIAKCWGSHGFVNFNRTVAVEKDVIFPLKKIRYEDTEFYAPNNPDKFLEKTFKDYNSIPVHLEIFRHISFFDEYLKRNNREYYIQWEKEIIKGSK